jgi:hypothetical protein
MPTPRQFDEPATVIIRVRVTQSQRRDLEQVARDNHTTLSGALREAADEYVGDYRENRPIFGNRRTPQET